ncbi:hypothetical protein [Deinococcus ruber]|uniref:Uncharacterized protein n=1 Tax=Deinococcus ruber TaxID=1848197 RepID=A0A918BXX7_9DEIO|nr:hypothetical protein [Deinococcus ruber]GGQ95789.1 hypothetical protein GCM10008957_05390 [Deinococcus ruber]
MDWQAALRELRPHLPTAREAWGVRGSLRWLEGAMRARGASASSVRNIVYRDIGTPKDRAALHDILSELAREAGRTLPPLPHVRTSTLPAELELLGRSKRRAFKQFLGALRAGRTARMVVSGPPGVGKTMLIEHLEREAALLPVPLPVRRLMLGGDVSAVLGQVRVLASQPFAVQAEAQAQAARAVLTGLEGVLLVRVERAADFAGVPPRDAHGAPISVAAWATEHLYRRVPAGLSVLLALEDDSSLSALPSEALPGEHIRLQAPTPAEARRYLMTRLNLPASRAEELVQQTGRHLDRLTLLAAARGEDGSPETVERLLSDTAAVRLLSSLSVCLHLDALSGPERSPLTRPLLEAALGWRLDELPAHVRALLDEVNAEVPRPVSTVLLSAVDPHLKRSDLNAALNRLAEATANDPAQTAVHLEALTRLGRWSEALGVLERHPDTALALALWTRARSQARHHAGNHLGNNAVGNEVKGEQLERLARAVVAHHAMLGDYSHPQARDALFTLLDSPTASVRAWGRVKLAESSVDAGNFEAAEAQLHHPELGGLLDAPPTLAGGWLPGVQADALLVGAALARWRGDLDSATRLAGDARTLGGLPTSGGLDNPARAALWRGLIAKDAGRWHEAVTHLGQVPWSHPLLSARARYQEGDLRLRLGQPAAALRLLLGAAQRLESERGAPEERARVEARIATALRRLGRLQDALTHTHRARELAGGGSQSSDPVLLARLDSESVPVLLALFLPDEALRVTAHALSLLGQPGPRRAEAAYRQRRTTYRAALAYLTRGAGLPYLQPFGGVLHDNADVRQARQLLDTLLTQPGGGLDREQVLTFDILLSRALADPDAAAALVFARRALGMTDHPYAETQARATCADALLRAGDADSALFEVNRAHALLRRVAGGLGDTEEPDPGLYALLTALEARCLLPGGALADTLRWVQHALEGAALAPFRAQVWRDLGADLERQEGRAEEVQAALRSLFPGILLGTLRLRDALAVAAV